MPPPSRASAFGFYDAVPPNTDPVRVEFGGYEHEFDLREASFPRRISQSFLHSTSRACPTQVEFVVIDPNSTRTGSVFGAAQRRLPCAAFRLGVDQLSTDHVELARKLRQEMESWTSRASIH
jgi:hypothetical protein